MKTCIPGKKRRIDGDGDDAGGSANQPFPAGGKYCLHCFFMYGSWRPVTESSLLKWASAHFFIF
jgi:hypothetical protein